MRNIYNLDDYYVLKQNGWNLKSNNTLIKYKKTDLLEIIRMLEHNWARSIKTTELQNRRLKNFYNYYKNIGEEEIFKILTNEEYNLESKGE